jgi:hypothetical protein
VETIVALLQGPQFIDASDVDDDLGATNAIFHLNDEIGAASDEFGNVRVLGQHGHRLGNALGGKVAEASH